MCFSGSQKPKQNHQKRKGQEAAVKWLIGFITASFAVSSPNVFPNDVEETGEMLSTYLLLSQGLSLLLIKETDTSPTWLPCSLNLAYYSGYLQPISAHLE